MIYVEKNNAENQWYKIIYRDLEFSEDYDEVSDNLEIYFKKARHSINIKRALKRAILDRMLKCTNKENWNYYNKFYIEIEKEFGI